MLECLILGDSIAVGVGRARPECLTHAVTGITSAAFLQTRLPAHMAETIVISLGANDSDAAVTADSVEKLRASLTASRVYWLLARASPGLRAAVRGVAERFHDHIIDVAPLAGPDGLHPDSAGYVRLAGMTRLGGPASPPEEHATYPDFLPRYHVYPPMPQSGPPGGDPSGVKVWNGPFNWYSRETPDAKTLR